MGTRVYCLLLILMTSTLHQVKVHAIFTTEWPVSTSQFQNTDVEFFCEVREKESNVQVVWFTDMDPTDSQVKLTFANETTDLTEYDNSLHGQHSIEYEMTSDGVHKLIYRIKEIMPADDGLYACGFVPLPVPQYVSSSNVLGDYAILEVLVPPNDSHPQCDFDTVTVDFSSFSKNSTIPVNFSCEMTGGKPEPKLTWYRQDNSITESVTNFNGVRYTLSADDNGVEFTCMASGHSLPENVSCSFTPLQIPPTVSITSSSGHVESRDNVSIVCAGDGLPYVSAIEWFVNGVRTNEIENLEFEILDNQTDSSSSQMNIYNAQFEHRNNLIECIVMVPSGLQSKAFVSLTYKAGGTGGKNALLIIPLFPLIASVSGLLVAILVIFIIILVCTRSKGSDSEEGLYDGGEPIDAHAHINPYQEEVIDTNDNRQPAQSGDGYVFDQLPGAFRGATMRSEHPYATIQRDATLHHVYTPHMTQEQPS